LNCDETTVCNISPSNFLYVLHLLKKDKYAMIKNDKSNNGGVSKKLETWANNEINSLSITKKSTLIKTWKRT